MEAFFNRNLGLGLAPDELTIAQILARTFILFFAMLLMMRIAGLRFLAGKTTFDVLLGFILASMLSRCINGPAPFWGTILAGFLVVFLHRVLAWLTYHFHAFGCWVKGCPEPLVENGQPYKEVLARNCISDHDLKQDLRLNALTDLSQVKVAILERNGEISIQRQDPSITITSQEDGKTIHVHFHS
ncbi:MAG TPA: YetF domain-containing protein [Verrucomicrobiae bacterium]